MEATPEQSAEGMAIVRVLSAVLDRLIQANGPIARADPGQVTKFHAMKAPGIGIQQYLERIHKYASCSNECFILALIYIDRLIQRSNFLLTDLNVHRVVITSVLLAAKFFDDAYYNNAYYAKVGGVLVSEMNGLEVDFLFRINFSLHVAPDVFEKYRAELLLHSNSTVVVTPPPTVVMDCHHSPPMESVHPQTMLVPSPTSAQHCPQMDAGPIYAAAEVLMNASQLVRPVPERLIQDGSHGIIATSSEDMIMGESSFPVMHRANSMPPVVDQQQNQHHRPPSYSVNHHAQPRCYHKPLGPPPMTSKLHFADDPFGLMERRIYPIQNTLVHHHHGTHFSHHAGADAAYNAQLLGRMLAGVSGGM